INVFVFTSEYIQEHPALQPKMEGIFKGVFSAARLGLKKTDVETYKIIANKIDLKPEEILYIDDKQANLDAAKEAGLAVIHYESNKQAEADIQKVAKNFSFRKGS
ncbi:MAG: HAD-IA family hydrolase, partial [bacterium]|nr:HAD-IA family hydrolase [bacterium]